LSAVLSSPASAITLVFEGAFLNDSELISTCRHSQATPFLLHVDRPSPSPPAAPQSPPAPTPLQSIIALGFSREEAERALAHTKGDVSLAANYLLSSPPPASSLSSAVSGRPVVVQGEAGVMARLLRSDPALLETMIRQSERSSPANGRWFRQYPELLLRHLGIQGVPIDLDPFRTRAVAPSTRRLPDVASECGVVTLPAFRPERHVTPLKGRDALAFVDFCEWASLHRDLAAGLRDRPDAVARITERLRNQGRWFAQFVADHPEVAVREMGLERPTRAILQLSPDERRRLDELARTMSVPLDRMVRAYLDAGRDVEGAVDALIEE
jgi:hypothetical protein